jgi:hypothetical protein
MVVWGTDETRLLNAQPAEDVDNGSKSNVCSAMISPRHVSAEERSFRCLGAYARLLRPFW